MGFFDNIGLGNYVGGIDIGGWAGKIVSGLGIFMMMLFFAIVVGFIGYFIMRLRKYKYRVTVFKSYRGDEYRPEMRDRAMMVKAGMGGEQMLYLLKTKSHKNAYGRTIDKNHYAFAVAPDGYWHNVTFGGLDKALQEINIKPTHPAVRYIHEGLRQHVDTRYGEKNWFKENIGLIFSIGSIVIVLLFMWLLADKYFTIQNAALQSVELAKQVNAETKNLIGALDHLCTGISRNI